MSRAGSGKTSDVPQCCGVYLLTHLITGDTYVGSATNVRLRAQTHFSRMKCGQFQNKRIATLCRENGVRFRAECLERCEHLKRRDRERRWIKRLKPTLNCAKVNDHGAEHEPTTMLRVVVPERYRIALEAIADAEQFRPTVSQLVNVAIRRFLERDAKPAPRSRDR
jgi:predicted GIY-YIG superfamily endonuclease